MFRKVKTSKFCRLHSHNFMLIWIIIFLFQLQKTMWKTVQGLKTGSRPGNLPHYKTICWLSVLCCSVRKHNIYIHTNIYSNLMINFTSCWQRCMSCILKLAAIIILLLIAVVSQWTSCSWLVTDIISCHAVPASSPISLIPMLDCRNQQHFSTTLFFIPHKIIISQTIKYQQRLEISIK